jgi:hypothetical protein
MMIKRPEWLDEIKADGISTLTARTINSSTSCACAGVIGGKPEGKLTAVTINGMTAFVWLTPDTDGKYRFPFEAIYTVFPSIKRGYCIHPGR